MSTVETTEKLALVRETEGEYEILQSKVVPNVSGGELDRCVVALNHMLRHTCGDFKVAVVRRTTEIIAQESTRERREETEVGPSGLTDPSASPSETSSGFEQPTEVGPPIQ